VNKPGGGGIVGARAALKEPRPDGYTVLIDIHTTSSMHIGAFKTPPLMLADRKYAARVVRDPMVFAVKADAPWKTFKEFSDRVKANPGELVWSSVGPSGPSRYTAFDWFTQIGVDPAKTKMVITEGAADSFTKLASRHVVLSIHSVAEAHAMLKAGKHGAKPREVAIARRQRASCASRSRRCSTAPSRPTSRPSSRAQPEKRGRGRAAPGSTASACTPTWPCPHVAAISFSGCVAYAELRVSGTDAPGADALGPAPRRRRGDRSRAARSARRSPGRSPPDPWSGWSSRATRSASSTRGTPGRSSAPWRSARCRTSHWRDRG
jgi:Tripartite tricarboxylate transporter family receptor